MFHTPLAPLLQQTVFPPTAAFVPFQQHMQDLNLPLSAALPALK